MYDWEIRQKICEAYQTMYRKNMINEADDYQSQLDALQKQYDELNAQMKSVRGVARNQYYTKMMRLRSQIGTLKNKMKSSQSTGATQQQTDAQYANDAKQMVQSANAAGAAVKQHNQQQSEQVQTLQQNYQNSTAQKAAAPQTSAQSVSAPQQTAAQPQNYKRDGDTVTLPGGGTVDLDF